MCNTVFSVSCGTDKIISTISSKKDSFESCEISKESYSNKFNF